MLLEAGSSLGPFRIVSLVGRGGMASVYKAYEPELDRYVALKVLPTAFLHDTEFARRFEREAKVIARLEHPHIVPIHRFGIDAGTPWMSMRLLRIETLASLLAKGRLDGRRMVTVLGEVADALDYAHRRKVVHRDVKPGNILFDGEECAYVGDFGIARIAEASVVLTQTGTIAGTPQYMSPEQALGRRVDHRTDLYALGVIAYEMVTGRLPFAADNVMALLMQHAHEQVPVPGPDEAPASVIEPIVRCLEKDPARRWPTAAAFVGALADGLDSSAAEETVLIARSWKHPEPGHDDETTAAPREGPRAVDKPSLRPPSAVSVDEAAPSIAFESVSRSKRDVGPTGFVRAGIGAAVVMAAAFVVFFLATRPAESPEPGLDSAIEGGAGDPAAPPEVTTDSTTGGRQLDGAASSTTRRGEVTPREAPTASSPLDVPTRRTRSSPTPAQATARDAAAEVTENVRIVARIRSAYEQGDLRSALDMIETGLQLRSGDAALRQLLVELETDARGRATHALDESIGAADTAGDGLFDDGYAQFENGHAFGGDGRLFDAAQAFLKAEELFVAAAEASGDDDGERALDVADAGGAASTYSNDRQGVEDTVRRYARAYERKSTVALKAVFPSLTPEELDSIDRSFLDWESVTMDLAFEQVSIDGPRAEVWMRQRQMIVPVEGGVRRTETGLVMSLAKAGAGPGAGIGEAWSITGLRQIQ